MPCTAHTVLIADDHALVREGLKLLVANLLPQAQIVEAADATSVFSAVNSAAHISLALVELNMPGMERGAKLKVLARSFPELPLVVVSALRSPDIVQRAIDLPSVYAFVSKSSSAHHLRLAIQAALQRTKLKPPQRAGSERPDAGLTPRMREIRQLLRHGKTNKQIARALNITEGTVKNHMTEIFRLLEVSNRTQAAQYDPDQP